MGKNSLFRTSLFGYNKNDVTEYLDDLNVRYTKQGDELSGEIISLRGEFETEKQNLTSALLQKEKELSEIALSLEKSNEQNTALNDKVKELSSLLDEAKKENLDSQTRLSRMQNEIDQKRLELEAEKQAIHQKAKAEEEEFSLKVEGILSQVRAEAQSVIAKANETAASIIANAKKKVSEKSEAVHDSKDSTPSSRIKESFTDIFKNHKAKLDSIFSSFRQDK